MTARMTTPSPAAPTTAEPLAVAMRGIVKGFNGIPVLHGVDFDLRAGEVHALMGGNGAGKSTLMKILQGVYTADAGTILIDGVPASIRTPQDAKGAGVGMVFQEFSLIPTLTVAQNIFLTNEPRGGLGLLNDAEAERRARALFSEMGVEIDPRAEVARLSTGYWQLTEIAKALSQNVRVLILDEPTAALAVAETQSLFDLIRILKARGIAIIYISHRMEEIFQIADRITVMRDGQVVLSSPTAGLSMHQLVEQIVGRKMEHAFAWKERNVDRSGVPILELRNLRAGPRVRDVSLRLYPGEILGIAGLMGSGRTELLRALFGIDRAQAGEIVVRGRTVAVRNPQEALAAGICLVPEDRRAQGLVLGHSVKDNLLLPLLKGLRRGLLIDDARGDRLVQSYVERLQVKTDSIHKRIRLLSGGNQQKVVIAKWLASDPEILLMDEPTAGVDIGSKSEILAVIRGLADEGKGVIVVSSEFTELLAVADRVLVLRNGAVTRELERQEIENEEALEQAVQRASAAEVQLSDTQLEHIRARKASAAISMHTSGDEWSAAQLAGLRAQFERMGVAVVGVTEAQLQPERQVADVEALLAKRPDILVSVPTDPAATSGAYRAAAAQGVKVVFMDNLPHGLVEGHDYVSVVSSNNYGNGVTAAHLLAQRLGGQGQIGIVFHDADYAVTRQRYDAFKRTIEDDYPAMKILAERGVRGPDVAGEAEQVVEAMLAAHPQLAGIWAVWDTVAEGAVAALRRSGRQGVSVTTVDLGAAMARELARGDVVVGVAAQRPYDHGVVEAMLAGYALLGEPAPADVIIDGLAVTRENLLEAWKSIYRQDAPAELAALLRP